MSEYSVLQLANFIESLPADKEAPEGTQGFNNYNTQKAHWLGWLDSKSTTGSYQRQEKSGRGAKYVYNHIMEPKMLLWLIAASGLQVEIAKDASLNTFPAHKYFKLLASSCAAIRKVLPWQALEVHLNNQ